MAQNEIISYDKLKVHFEKHLNLLSSVYNEINKEYSCSVICKVDKGSLHYYPYPDKIYTVTVGNFGLIVNSFDGISSIAEDIKGAEDIEGVEKHNYFFNYYSNKEVYKYFETEKQLVRAILKKINALKIKYEKNGKE